MKCLNRLDVQKYLDKEYDLVTQERILQHLNDCEECSKLYKLAIDDKILINRLLSDEEWDTNVVQIPKFRLPIRENKKYRYLIFTSVIVAASIIGVMLVLQLNKEQNATKMPEAEIVMYEFLDGKDLNKLWHDKSQILILQDGEGNVIQSTIIY